MPPIPAGVPAQHDRQPRVPGRPRRPALPAVGCAIKSDTNVPHKLVMHMLPDVGGTGLFMYNRGHSAATGLCCVALCGSMILCDVLPAAANQATASSLSATHSMSQCSRAPCQFIAHLQASSWAAPWRSTSCTACHPSSPPTASRAFALLARKSSVTQNSVPSSLSAMRGACM